MNIQERQQSLLNEAKALAYFFGVTSDKLSAAFILFSSLYESTHHVSSDEFTDALNAIDSEIEDLCISNKISQEKLEELMENNFSFKAVAI